MHSNLIYSDCSKLIMCIDTELSQIKKFSDAYTILNDWQLETRYDNTSPNNIIQNSPPDFLNNACGVFELTSHTKAGTSRFINATSNAEDITIEATFDLSKLEDGQKTGLIFGFKDWNNYNYVFNNY